MEVLKETLKGRLSPVRTMSGTLASIAGVAGSITVATGSAPAYTGEYEVTPEFETQKLYTKDRTMMDDVTVQAIVVSRTTNPSGGNTVYIGGIFDG